MLELAPQEGGAAKRGARGVTEGDDIVLVNISI